MGKMPRSLVPISKISVAGNLFEGDRGQIAATVT